MDPVTQGLFGAAWAQPAARPPDLRFATLVGCVSGMAPDIDILIRSDTDPLLALEFHRHFTHSLAFVPIGALLCALLLYPIYRGKLGFPLAYLFAALGFASHGLLDACTSYGTLLMWPFSKQRIAWDIVSVIDPLFTLPLLVLIGLAFLRRQPRFAVIGLAWSAFYLGLGLIQHGRAEAVAAELAASRGHQDVEIEVKPSFANILLWKSIYAFDGYYHVDAVRVGVSPKVFAGETRVRLDVARDFPWLEPDSQQWRDLERFGWFADGHLALDRDNPLRVVDMRYSLVPNQGDGLWGVELDPARGADEHVSYVTMRVRSFTEGGELLRMLFR